MTDRTDDPQTPHPSTDGFDLDDLSALTREEIVETLDAATTDFTPIRLPRAIMASIRARKAEESAHPTQDGSFVSVSYGEVVAFAWRFFIEQFPEADGSVATWAQELRRMRTQLEAALSEQE